MVDHQKIAVMKEIRSQHNAHDLIDTDSLHFAFPHYNIEDILDTLLDEGMIDIVEDIDDAYPELISYALTDLGDN
jgi:DNA-binding PadR family transcriptional regulator